MKTAYKYNRGRNFKIWAVIPAYNEESCVGAVVEQALKYVSKAVVVNDYSTDNTAAVALSKGAEVINLKKNMGAGFATRIGCDAVFKNTDIIVTLDADGQHDPKDIPKLIKPLKKGEADIIFGRRLRNKKMPIIKRTGNYILSVAVNLFFKIQIGDPLTGFHAFTSLSYPKLRWNSSGYGVVTEIVYKVAANNLKYKEVTVKTIYKNKRRGMRKRDGIKSIVQMARWKISDYI